MLLSVAACSCATCLKKPTRVESLYPYGNLLLTREELVLTKEYRNNLYAQEECSRQVEAHEIPFVWQDLCLLIYDIGDRYDFAVDVLKKYETQTEKP